MCINNRPAGFILRKKKKSLVLERQRRTDIIIQGLEFRIHKQVYFVSVVALFELYQIIYENKAIGICIVLSIINGEKYAWADTK